MPALSTAERATFDQTYYPAVGYVYISQPELIFEAPLNGVFYSNDAIVALDYGTPTTGVYTDIEAEMTVEIWANDANLYGSQRIRPKADGTVATTDAIYVGRCSKGTRPGELSYVGGATVRIYDERRIWAKNPYIDPNTGTQFKDQIAYVSDNFAQPPVANAGPDMLVIVDSDSDTADIDLDALGTVSSFAVRNGATLSTYLWDLADGTVVSGTVNDSSLTARFGTGERYVALTVTDSNSIEHTAYKWVVVATRDQCSPARIRQESISPNGVQLEIEIDAPQLASASRPNSRIIYGTDNTHGATGSKQLVFSGWMSTEQPKLDAKNQRRTISIMCEDIGQRLRSLFGFPLTVSNESSETGWYRMPDATIDRLAHHYLQWHTNVLALADFTWSGQGATYPLPQFTTSGSTLWDQAYRLAKAIGYVLTCNTSGQLRVLGDPQILPTSSQATEYNLPTQRTTTEVTTLTSADYGEVSFEANRPSQYYWVRSSAVVASATVGNISAVKCSAPGKTPAQGVSSSEETELLVTSQDELNVRAGNDYAARKSPAFSPFTFPMLKTAPVFEPADMEWVRIVMPSEERARYPFLSASGNRFLIQQIVNSYDHKTMRRSSTLVAEIEIEGIPAQTVVDPPPQVDQYPAFQFDDYYVPLQPEQSFPEIDTAIYPGIDNIIMVLDNGTIAVTSDFTTPSYESGPTWTVYDHSASIGIDVLQFAYGGNGSGVAGWFVTEDEIYYGEDLETASPTFTLQHTFSVSSSVAGITVDNVLTGGLFAIVIRQVSGVINTWSTIDGGTTWGSAVTVSLVNDGGHVPGVAISSVTPGKAWATALDVFSPVTTSGLFLSTDYGDTWTLLDENFDEDGVMSGMVFPYRSELYAYSGHYDGFFDGFESVPANTNNLARHQPEGSTLPITAIVDSVRYGPDWQRGRNTIAVSDVDPAKVAYVGINYARSSVAVFATANGLSGAPTWVATGTPGALDYRRCLLVNEGYGLYVFGVNGAIAVTGDPYTEGTLDDRIGNLSTTAEVLGIAGY